MDQNLDAQNRPDNSAPFNESLQNQVTVWICLYFLPGCLSEFQTKKDETDAMVNQNLDAQNCPDNSAPFNKSLWNQVTVWIRLYCLPGCLSEFRTKKYKTDAMEDQNLDTQNCPDNLAPFNE